jgi:uncharacterized membrane protein YoaK (UPF0700 family)
MSENVLIVLITFLVPFTSLVLMFCVIAIVNRKTTAEIKFWLPPETLLKVMALLLIVVVTFLLGYLKILDQSVIAAIIGSVASGTVGMAMKDK